MLETQLLRKKSTHVHHQLVLERPHPTTNGCGGLANPIMQIWGLCTSGGDNRGGVEGDKLKLVACVRDAAQAVACGRSIERIRVCEAVGRRNHKRNQHNVYRRQK